MSDPDFQPQASYKKAKPANYGKGKSARGKKSASKGTVTPRKKSALKTSPKIAKSMVKDERDPGDSELRLRLGVTGTLGDESGKSPKDTPSQDHHKLPLETAAHYRKQHFGLKIHTEVETRTDTEPPDSSKIVQGKLRKKSKDAPSSINRSKRASSHKLQDSGKAVKGRGRSTHEADTEYAPPTRRREIQQSIKDHFMVRRSTRKCKTVLETEEFDKIAEKLKTMNEEGLAVTEVEGKGRGVVSTRPFRKGELICEYSGELITYEEAKKREDEYSRDPSVGCYMYYYVFKTKKLCVDATRDNGRFGRLLNHSKTVPNVTTKLLEVAGQPYLCLMAARDIQPGEELEYDYGERSKAAIESHPWLKA